MLNGFTWYAWEDLGRPSLSKYVVMNSLAASVNVDGDPFIQFSFIDMEKM